MSQPPSSVVPCGSLARMQVNRTLQRGIRGQAPILHRLAAAASRAALGLAEVALRFLFLGPTGVGKTQTALELSRAIFGREAERLDMSEFQRQESIEVLLGNLQGDKGRLGTMAGSADSGVLLLDEIEKAHPKILDLLLQMLEPGHITLACGQRLDLRQWFIVCTSNIATAEIVDLLHSSPTTIERHVRMRAEKYLRPELVNRFDEILVFSPLEYDIQLEIAELRLAEKLEFLRTKGYRLEAGPGVLEFVVRHGFDRRYGARPLQRAINSHIGDAVANDVQAGGNGCGVLQVNETGLHLVLAKRPVSRDQCPAARSR